jgi:hypothetical protein
MPPTLRAHCGACTAPLTLVQTAQGVYYRCPACGIETPTHPTAAEADADVLWLPLTRKRGPHESSAPR